MAMLKKTSLALTVLFSALVAIPPLATDLGLPAFAATAHALHCAPATMALTLSFFMMGFAIGPLLYGPASERFGRKPVLLAGLMLFSFAGILCTFTPSLWLLLAARLVQGFAASSGTVLAVACVRDLYDGTAGRRKMSYIMMINGLMPLTAPILGVYVLAFADWRAIYGTMAVWGLLLLGVVWTVLPETIRKKNPAGLAPRQLLESYRAVIVHPISLRASLINAFGFGSMFAYISGSSILFMTTMHLPAETYGLIFACTVTGSIGGTFTGNLLHRWGLTTRQVLRLGLVMMLAATATLLVLCAGGIFIVVPMVALLCLSNFGIGMVGPNASYCAVQYLPHLAGPAAAVLACTQMVMAAISAGLMSVTFALIGTTAMPLVMFGFAVLAGLSFLSLPKVSPPVAPCGL